MLRSSYHKPEVVKLVKEETDEDICIDDSGDEEEEIGGKRLKVEDDDEVEILQVLPVRKRDLESGREVGEQLSVTVVVKQENLEMLTVGEGGRDGEEEVEGDSHDEEPVEPTQLEPLGETEEVLSSIGSIVCENRGVKLEDDFSVNTEPAAVMQVEAEEVLSSEGASFCESHWTERGELEEDLEVETEPPAVVRVDAEVVLSSEEFSFCKGHRREMEEDMQVELEPPRLLEVQSKSPFDGEGQGMQVPEEELPAQSSSCEDTSCGVRGIVKQSQVSPVSSTNPLLAPPPMPPFLRVLRELDDEPVDNQSTGDEGFPKAPDIPLKEEVSNNINVRVKVPAADSAIGPDETGYYRIDSLACIQRIRSVFKNKIWNPEKLRIKPPKLEISKYWLDLMKLLLSHWQTVTSLTLEFNHDYPVESMVNWTKMLLFRTQNLQSLKIVYYPVGAPKTIHRGVDTSNLIFPRVLPLRDLDLSEALVPVVLIHVLVGTYGGQLTSLRIQSAVCTKALGEILRNMKNLSIYHVIPKTLGLVGALLSGNSSEGRRPWLTNLKMFLSGKHLANMFFPWLSPFMWLREISIELEQDTGVLESFSIPGIMCNQLESLETLNIKLNKVQSSFSFMNWLTSVKTLNLTNVTGPNFNEDGVDPIDKEVKKILNNDSTVNSDIWQLLPHLEEMCVEWGVTQDQSIYKRPSVSRK